MEEPRSRGADAEVRSSVYRDAFTDQYLRTLTGIGFLSQCLLFVVVISLVVISISELAARDSMLTLITSRSSALKTEYIEATKTPAPSSAASAPADRRFENTLREIGLMEDLKRSIQSLAALGGEHEGKALRAIEWELAQMTRLADRPRPSAAASGVAGLDMVTRWKGALLLLSSDQLLAIIVLGCGAIGAMISSLRAGHSLSLRAFILGLASGFVAYLVIKGGKHVFLLQAPGDVIAFNPYGSAFAGLIAGLFTEKAHQLLSYVVDDFANRVKAASTAGNGQAAASRDGKADAAAGATTTGAERQ